MTEPRDRWEKIEIISKIVSSIVSTIAAVLLPIILLYLGNAFTMQQNTSSRLTDMITHLSSNNARERRIAIEVTQYFAKNNQLPKEILPVLFEIAINDSNRDVSRGAVRSLKNVAETNKNLAPSIQQSLAALPRRVYIQIANEGQREKAKNIQNELHEKNLLVPGIENVGGNAERPDHANVQYFDPQDRATAETIVQVLNLKGVTSVNLTLVPDMQTKSGTFEIWLASTKGIAPSGGFDSRIFDSGLFKPSK